eukprot:TRINITY_DN6674_c0_g1_i1.p1 TRINITY_DN6674_c0_g1~~TRINITY_DN6674_c0_g1_i1.p1  ORF type:complete len:387 (-),score=99.77 TRINITY_DN6674_c0_g1_i1:152-1312(-)
MAVYNDSLFVEKLSKLLDTQESIETVSRWALVHRKMFSQIASTWSNEFYKAPVARKLAFIYLANDIMQRSRRDGNEFLQAFSSVIADAIVHAWETRAAPMDRLNRMLNVWQERHVFSDTFVDSIRSRLGMPQGNGVASGAHLSLPAAAPAPSIAPPAEPYIIPTSLPLVHPLASLLPPLSNAAAPSSSATASTMTPLFTKIFKDAIPILISIENSSLELEMLRDRVDMVRPDLVSGAEISAKIDANDAAAAAQLIHELDDDFTHISNFQEAIHSELARRDSLIEILKSIVAEQESVLSSLEKEAQSVADLAIRAEDTLRSHQSKKRERNEDIDAKDAESTATDEPPAKAAKLNGDEEAEATDDQPQLPTDADPPREVLIATSEDMF